MTGHRPEHETAMIGRELSAARDLQQVVVIEFLLSDAASELQSLRPLDLDRCDGKKQRSWKVALGANGGLLERFFGSEFGETFGKSGRREWLDVQEIDSARHGRLQAIDRGAGDGADAGAARAELRPISGLAGAQRSNNAHAGDDDDRPSEFVAWCCHVFPTSQIAVVT